MAPGGGGIEVGVLDGLDIDKELVEELVVRSPFGGTTEFGGGTELGDEHRGCG